MQMFREVLQLYFLLQVTQIHISITSHATQQSVSGTAGHAHYFWMCNEIKGSYDKIKITHLLPLVMLIQTTTNS